MSNGNTKYPQYTRNMTEAQKAQFDYMINMFETRRQRPLVSGITVSEEDKEYKLSDYDQDIQNLLANEQYGAVQEDARIAGINKILELGGMDSESFFRDKPEATAIDAMRATNYKGFADKEKIYNSSNFRNENTSKEALKKLNDEYNATFQNSFLFPEMGAGLNELLPDYIKNDPEKRAQFERAFYYERGAKIDFDESGRVGDITSDSLIGDAARGAGYYLNDLMAEVIDSTIGTATAVYDIFGGDPSQADEEFLKKQKAGEIETAMEREERLQGEGVGFDDDIFWAAFSSPEARRQLYSSNKGTVRTVDFQAIMDRGGINEATAGELWGAGMDQLIQSAPLLIDLALGSGIAKGLLKGATRKIGTRATARAGKKSIRKEGSKLVRDSRGRFISEQAANQIDDRVDYMLAEATKSKQRLNQVGAFFVSDALVASQMHSDNVGQDWYDNLSGGERFAYLGVQAGAEVASGMVLSNIFARGFGAGKMTQKIFKGQKASARDYAKNIVRSSFLGATEEVIAEGATAGVQYWSEMQARIAGGDATAYYDPKEMNRRIYEGASAGLLMGGLAGGFSGTVGGPAQATLGNFANSTIEARKELDAATRAVDQAATATAKAQAMRRLENATKKFSAAQGAMARAYNALAQSDRESFDEIARTQGQINALVQRYKEADDPEYQGSVEQEIKALVEKKQKLEQTAAKKAGVESFSELYERELKKLQGDRTEKEKSFRAKLESDPQRLAEKEIAGQLEAQKEAFDAAMAANSPDQNADDDVQDREGKTQGDSKAEREEAQDNSVKGDGDNQFAASIDEDTDVDDRVKSKYRDVIGTVNNLMQAFKKFGIKVVLHKTSDSYLKATGKTGRGVFFRDKSTKTIHMDLEMMATGKEAEGLFGVYDTPAHEFMHLAFTTADVATLKRYKAELLGLARQVGLEAEVKKIFAAVDKAYADKNLSEADKLNEQLTNALERMINALPEARKPGFIERALRSFLRIFGLDKAIMGQEVTSTDFLNFIKEFKEARDEGVEFKREEIPMREGAESADMDSRDLGVRQPSKAYPDLINKVVNYRVVYLDKLGGQQSYQTNGLRFNDYWHFRNWYLKETGNGKMADNLAGFTYTGDDGTLKTINPPKPKRDRETGQIIDMEPRLRTPTQRKMDTAQSQEVRRRRATRYRDIKVNAGKALKFAVGKIEKIGRTGELTFYNENMLLEQDSQSELPVAYSETFFVDGLNVNELDQLGTDFGNNLEFAIPTTQEADLAFTVRNNGDGTVTIDAHSDAATDAQADTVQSVEVPSDTQALESVELESDDLSLDASRFTNAKLAVIKLADMIGKFLSVVGYDGTNYEGESGIYQDTPLGYLLSFSTKRKAKEGLDELRQRAIDDYNKRRKDGDDSLKGSIFVAPVVMGEGSMLSNKRVCKEVIKLIEESNLTDAEVVEIFNALLKDNKKQSKLKSLLGAADMMLDTGRAPEGFKNVNIGKKVGGVDNTYTMPVTKAALIQTLESANNVRSMTTRNNIFSFVTGTSFGSKSIDQLTSIRELKNSELAREGLVGIMPLIKEYSYELELVDGRLELAGVEIDSPDSRKDLAFPVGIKVKEGSIKEFQPEKRLAWLDLLSAFKRSGKRKSIGQEVSTAEKAYQRAKDAVKNARISDSSRQKVDALYSSILENRKGNLLTERDEVQIINNENLNKSEEAYLKRLTKRDAAKKERDSIRSAVKASERSLLGAEVTRNVGAQESIDLGLDPDNESNLPFEPNNLNAFQAFMARMDQLFANKYANVFSLQRAIEGAKKAVVDISQDFINAETLMYGKTANDLEKLDGKVKVISQEMKDAGLVGQNVSQFLIARHAEERNALIAERTNGETLDGSGMSNERAQEVMDSFSPEQKAALESIAKKVDAITKDTRQTMVKFGLESQETIDAFEEMFENYVPLGGLSVDEMSADTSLYPTGGAGMSVYGDTTRRARGRASEANNVLAQAIAQNAAVHAKARKNEALSALYNLVKENKNTKVWKITKQVPFDAQSAVGVRIDGEQQFIVFTNPDHAKALKNMGVEKLDLFSKFMRRFSGFLRRSFTTANPEFIISNFARDIQSALFNAMAEADIPGGQIQSKYIATKIIQRVKQTLPALLKDSVGRDMDAETAAYFEEFKEDGGQTGWGFVKDVGTIAAEIEAEVNEKNKAQKARDWMMKNSIDVVENVNDAFENSIRLAAYIEARKAGTSREKAAELAKNITVNFNRSGELGPVANSWYMFFNASVQGTVRLARSLGKLKDVRKPDGELEAWYNRLNSAQKMAAGLSLISGMLTAINLGLSEEDEDGELFYNKIPDYEKERNLIIMYDGENYLKVPLPYGFNVFANLGTAMAESAGGHREPEDAGMFLLNSAFSSFSPISFGQSKDAAKYLAKGATPTFLKPFVDIAVNETYFGSSVYREQFPVGAPKPESEMSFRSPEGVRSFFKWMNEATGGTEFVPGALDFNPDKFWYGFEYYIGGAGQFVTRTLGTGRDLYETVTTGGEKVPMKANDFPFLRKVYGEPSRYYDADVYTENANLVSQLFKERKEAENKNDKRYKNITRLESARKKTEKQIKRLRKLRRDARDIKDYVQRQQRIYELYEKERSLLMQFNKQFEKLRGKD